MTDAQLFYVIKVLGLLLFASLRSLALSKLYFGQHTRTPTLPLRTDQIAERDSASECRVYLRRVRKIVVVDELQHNGQLL